MGKVGDREVYENSEYDIADRMYVNILFFKKAYSLSKSTLFAHFFICILYFLWKLCITYTLRSFTLCLQLTPVIQNLWFIYRFIRTTLCFL